ncbi:chromosome segregation protein SMC [Candidatus Woesearchaeota archaeon]|nr:chromosome segregation protein SMC [Candidatus Woesearchaeota archaeon]
MTRIKKLILSGFKSFAKFTELQFGESYNCILGPNGSGKSNVLDALCFVLGKAGSKGLRAEKSANLIYNGGKSKSPAKKGEVSIFFDNREKTFPTEEAEVKVTRIIKPNGQSVYKINDQPRTRQQILDLLNIARINPGGYNIILQGDIIKFCEMSTTERRLLIEEISGISVYEEKKNKALNQLNKVEERLKEAEIILSERKAYLKDLKKDRDQALKFKEMNDSIKKYKASLLKMQIDKKEAESKGHKEKIDSYAAQLSRCREKAAALKQEIEKSKAEIEVITHEIEQKGETDQVSLNREIEHIKIDLTKKNSRIETLNSELSKIGQRKADLNAGMEDIEQKIAKLTRDKQGHLEKKKEEEKEKAEFAEKIKSFRKKNNIDEAADIEKKIDEIDSRAEKLAKDINSMRETQHNLLREKDKAEHELNTLSASIQKVKQIEKEHKKQLEELAQKREQFKKTTLELNKLLDEDSHLAAKLGHAKQQLHKNREELARLSARSASIREFSLSDKAVNAIIKKKGSVPGIHGTVSELGSVSPEYSLALEVAAGPRLKSIVVENEKIAADQIKYLKQNKLGIATFIPLSRIKPKSLDEKAKKLSSAKGSHGLASSLVKYQPKFKKVFSYVFGATLVVDNIDVARRLGIGSAKMVTLDGDLTETSGIMKGGYRGTKRKGLGFREDRLDKDIEKLAGKVKEAESGISSFEFRRKEIEQKIENSRKLKSELEGEIIKGEKSLHLDSSDISLSGKKYEDLEKKAAGLEQQVNKIQEDISEKNRELAKLKTEKQQQRSKISSLRNPALIAELSTYEEKQQKLSESILEIDSEIKNINTQVNDIFLPETEKTKNILKQLDKDDSSFSREIKQLKSEASEIEDVLKKKEQEAKSFYSKFKELFSKRAAVNDDINKKELEISRVNEKSREIEIKNNTLSIKNAEINASLSGLREEFSQYEGVQLDTEKNEEQLKYQIQKFESMKSNIGTVNMRALEIYEEIEREYNKLLEKKNTLIKEKQDVESMMQEIESRKKALFMKTYGSVNSGFQSIFNRLSKKGEASLELENKESPFEAGIGIKVRISGQKFLDIRSLSGGEKTMTALAFIFSIQEHDPASFYILDEVDAALDKHNSEKLAKLIRNYSQKAQYVIISHNDAIISEADNLYGTSMDEHGISRVISLKV